MAIGYGRSNTAGVTNRPDMMSIMGGGGGGDDRQYKVYEKAVESQGEDYSRLMDEYKKLIASGPSQEFRGAYGNMQGLAQTGGYSEGDIANIRARGVSPIRAMYANAQRNINRQRSLQGGYSPGYNALQAKMAREQSSLAADKMTDINAGLAERIAQNKIGLAGQLTGAAGEFDASKLRALQGSTSLYGTTPALVQTFGNQALQGAQFQNQINQQPTGAGMQPRRYGSTSWGRYAG